MTNCQPSDQVDRLLANWPEDSDTPTENRLGMFQPEPQFSSPYQPEKRPLQIHNDSFFRASRYTSQEGCWRIEPRADSQDGTRTGSECRARSTVSETPGVL